MCVALGRIVEKKWTSQILSGLGRDAKFEIQPSLRNPFIEDAPLRIAQYELTRANFRQQQPVNCTNLPDQSSRFIEMRQRVGINHRVNPDRNSPAHALQAFNQGLKTMSANRGIVRLGSINRNPDDRHCTLQGADELLGQLLTVARDGNAQIGFRPEGATYLGQVAI